MLQAIATHGTNQNSGSESNLIQFEFEFESNWFDSNLDFELEIKEEFEFDSNRYELVSNPTGLKLKQCLELKSIVLNRT